MSEYDFHDAFDAALYLLAAPFVGFLFIVIVAAVIFAWFTR